MNDNKNLKRVAAIAAALRCCGSSPKVDRCKDECMFYRGGYMGKCIPAMTEAAATLIEQLTAEPPNDPLTLEELRGMDGEIEKLRMQVKVKDACISGKSSIITHMETERDAARPSAEVLEAIDELVRFARPIMSTATWLGYVNVLNEWRGAQGEG